MRKHEGKFFDYGIYVLVILSIAMLIIQNKFYVNDLISHPQFGELSTYPNPIGLIKEAKMLGWYQVFFIIDFVWAALLLYYIYQWLLRINTKDKGAQKIQTNKFFLWLVLSFAVLAYVADFFENINYLYLREGSSFWFDIGSLELIKEIFYGVVLVILAYHVLSHYVFRYLKQIYAFLKTAILSLLIILIINFLVVSVAQGGTIMVDLFMKWWNILILFFFMNYLAIILSHYPAYFQNQVASGKYYDWNMTNKVFPTFFPFLNKIMQWCNLGIVTFSRNDVDGPDDEVKENGVVGGLRKVMGAMFFVVWLLILRFIMESFEMPLWEYMGPIILAAAGLMLFSHIKVENIKHEWDLDRNNQDLKENFVKHAKRTPILLYAFLISLMVTCLIVWKFEWHFLSIISITITSILNALYFTYFRVFRSRMQDIYEQDDTWDIHEDAENGSELHDPYNFGVNKHPNWLTKYILVYNANNQYYVRFLMYMLWLTIAFLLLININTDLSQEVNPMAIILAYLIAFYGVIVVAVKHFIYYYHYKGPDNIETLDADGDPVRPLHKQIRFILSILATVLGVIVISSTVGNDLHLLKPAELDQSNLISNQEFINSVPQYNKDSVAFTKNIQVAAYGGGLKSHLWTMLVLDKLQDESNDEFLRSTISMSGVSGGAVGIGNFSLIQEFKQSEAHEDSLIRALGMTNVLGSDLASLLGRDMFREWVPSFGREIFNGEDRSYLGMQVYHKILGMAPDRFEYLPFQNEWANIYRKQSYFPNLIFNSTSTKSRYGVSSAIREDHIFPGAIDLVDYKPDNEGKKNSITYYDVVSTTNRFPFLSPAAKIISKGHFVDGGYFENSGIMSSNSFYKYYANERNGATSDVRANPDNRDRLILNVINGPTKYIEEKFQDLFKYTKGKEQAEIGAIIATIAGTEGLPTYFIDQAKASGNYQGIFLPHKVTFDKVCSVFGGSPSDTLELIRRIKINNDMIDQALADFKPYKKKWGVVTPALSRLLSAPGVEYQRAMVAGHVELNEEIQQVIRLMYKENRANSE